MIYLSLLLFQKRKRYPRMSQKYNTLIFDLGGVLINWNPKNLYRKIFDTEAEVESFLSEIATMDWNEEQDGGRLIQVATQSLVAQYPQWRSEIEAYYSRWDEMLIGPIERTVSLLENIKTQGKYRLLALTNWSAETFPIAQERYPFLGWFEGILVSGVENLKKPDPAIYELILERYSVDRSEAVFIDDNLRNIEAARALGIKSIHFTTSEELRNHLEQIGISFL